MKSISFVLLSLCLFSCASRINKAVRDVKYSAWEKIGYEKRDLFKRELSNVKDDQEDSGKAFKDSLEQLKEVYGFDGGNLEREYNKLNDSYKDADTESKKVSASIEKLNTVAQDLFTEWEGENAEMKDSSLRKRSATQLRETRQKFSSLYSHLKENEKRVEPVLTKLHDQVLFLKHNLNAKAIAGLKSEGQRIEGDIDGLMKEIEKSNHEAEEFIKNL